MRAASHAQTWYGGPMGKSRPKKSGTPKKREVRHRAAADVSTPERASAPIEGVSGVMSGMVGGFKRAIGAERPAEKTWIDGALLWVVFALVLGIVAWRYWG